MALRSSLVSVLRVSCFAAALGAAPVRAHFILVAPDANRAQDGSGSPQKAPPCGEEGTVTATMKVTGYKAGDTVSITINETVFHPGHYRVSIAQTPDMLPPEPVVTAGATPCGTAPIMNPPVYPVLGDGLLKHTAPFSGPQTMSVTLPADFSCTKCTLQIIEFMSDHPLNVPGGCFYHHCADISVQAPPVSPGSDAGTSDAGKADDAAVPTSHVDASAPVASLDASSGTSHPPPKVDASVPSVDASASPKTHSDDSGCGLARSGSDMTALALVAFALNGLRRRRRSGSHH